MRPGIATDPSTDPIRPSKRPFGPGWPTKTDGMTAMNNKRVVVSLVEVKTEGIIMMMKNDAALMIDYDGVLHLADLAEFEFVDNDEHGDEVKPGDVIRVRFAEFVTGPKQLRDWLKS
jgi:hypothetical protein